MSTYTATVCWQRREGEAFIDKRYSRAHRWEFDGGAVVPGSSSPHSVKLPYSDAAAVDPEEALVAAVSSCHMLFFLAFAARDGYRVDSYVDEPIGTMEKGPDGKEWITRIELRPRIVFGGDKRPGADAVETLHHHSHEHCYIANSVRAEITVASRNEGIAP